MCGIAGYFGSRKIDTDKIERCLALMQQRGPDYSASRYFITKEERHVYLLHSRLSIIDLDERSHQPFPIGRKWIVYNGELYNYKELRAEMEKAGQGFRTESDTETLLSCIDYYGWEALERCEGMWAFAVYDEEEGSLTLCRDRFGEKPLYLYQDQSGIYFASEIKMIMALLGRKPEIDFHHLYRYMINGYRALFKGDNTFFKGILRLAPSHIMHIGPHGEVVQEVYWQPHFRPDDTMKYDDAVVEVRERLIRSVQLRLRSDVPLAFCMSGGVDSNSLISIAHCVHGCNVHGFTIAADDERYGERDMVDYVVAELGIRHTSIAVDAGSGMQHLRSLVKYHDEPVATVTYFVQWLLMKSISEHGYRVCISGTAADELFSGYYDHHLAYLYDVRHDKALFGDAVRSWTELVLPDIRSRHLRNPYLFINAPGFREHLYHDAEELRRYLTVEWNEPFTERHFTDSLLRNRMLNEMFHESVPVILHEEDLNAMFFSIENRSPYLDRELFELCFRIPTKHLVRNGFAKSVLRDAMRGIVPTRVLDNRCKVGFNAPVFSFLNTKDQETRSAILDGSSIFEHIRRDRVEELIEKESLHEGENKFLFSFLNSKIFLEEFSS